MAHRVGVCGSCGARFQIPPTFAHDRARCRTCGGVVEIGPLEGAASVVPAPAPAPEIRREPEPAPAPTPAPSPVAAPIPAAPETRRPNLVAILVGAAILAVLAFGAWKLIS